MSSPHPDSVTLNDYVDDALTAGDRAAVRDHVAGCAGCRAIVEGLQAVQSAARSLPPIHPRRETWDRIERGLRVDAATRGGRRALRWPWLAAAAALVLATFAGLKIAGPGHPAVPVVLNAPAEAPGEEATAQSVEAELLQAEQHYQKAISGLEQIANAGKGTLDPQTASTLEKNLTVVDQAISESRAALRSQPASEPAQASLLENFKAKIALLQDTVALINEMRRVQKGT